MVFFFFNDTATTEIYTLSLHDALPISDRSRARNASRLVADVVIGCERTKTPSRRWPSARRRSVELYARSEEHTSELQSRQYLVCRLLLEKKKKTSISPSRFMLHLHYFL